MVRGQHGEDRLLVAALEDRGGQSHRVDGVATGGLAEQVLVVEGGDRLEDRPAEPLGGADEAVARLDHALEAIDRLLEQAAVLGKKGKKLLGTLAAAQRPEPRAGASRHDHAVSHERSVAEARRVFPVGR